MMKAKIFAVLLFGMLSGCNIDVPTSLCGMPEGRQSWQNVKVNWIGTVIEISSPPHGGGRYFVDFNCGRVVPIEIPEKLSSYFPKHKPFSSYAAVAKFSIAGQLNVRDNVVIIDVSSAARQSQWLENKAAYEQLEALRAAVDKHFGRKPSVRP